MKYTLAANAISSLNIAIEYFKRFFYFAENYQESELDEARKICIVFLENSIELMLKCILVTVDPLSIYEHPNSIVIKKALEKVNNTNKLEDILILEGTFKTITYTETLSRYNSIFHRSEKLSGILSSLGERRNAITHFGISEPDDEGELLISILNVLDAIYNYLYPQLIELDDIGEYFTSDELFVSTIHGTKPLFDMDSFVYNNIVDFLDELLESFGELASTIRARNPKSRILEFSELMNTLRSDQKFLELLAHSNMHVDFIEFDPDHNHYSFEIENDDGMYDAIISCYSPYFNVTAFCGEAGNIYFLVAHCTHELFIYNQGRSAFWSQSDEAEPDKQWLTDLSDGICCKCNLSKRNLYSAFESILRSEST